MSLVALVNVFIKIYERNDFTVNLSGNENIRVALLERTCDTFLVFHDLTQPNPTHTTLSTNFPFLRLKGKKCAYRKWKKGSITKSIHRSLRVKEISWYIYFENIPYVHFLFIHTLEPLKRSTIDKKKLFAILVNFRRRIYR